MKYIVFEDMYVNIVPILFPDCLTHKDVADQFKGIVILSAGFCRVLYDSEAHRVKAYACGTSVSLNVSARVDEDSKLITRVLNLEL